MFYAGLRFLLSGKRQQENTACGHAAGAHGEMPVAGLVQRPLHAGSSCAPKTDFATKRCCPTSAREEGPQQMSSATLPLRAGSPSSWSAAERAKMERSKWRRFLMAWPRIPQWRSLIHGE